MVNSWLFSRESKRRRNWKNSDCEKTEPNTINPRKKMNPTYFAELNRYLKTYFAGCVALLVTPPLYTVPMRELKINQNKHQRNNRWSPIRQNTNFIEHSIKEHEEDDFDPRILAGYYLDSTGTSTGSFQAETALELRVVADSAVRNRRAWLQFFHKQRHFLHNSSQISVSTQRYEWIRQRVRFFPLLQDSILTVSVLCLAS